MTIKVNHAALDETESGDIILRGVIDPGSLHELKVDDYQREIAPRTKIATLAKALRNGTVPDVELGMRGGNFTSRKDSYYLHNDVYIVDGLQRVTAARYAIAEGIMESPAIGATIHFNTDKQWEMRRFKILNIDRTKLSPNVLLRNFREEIPAVAALCSLSKDKGFVLCRRICWSQRMKRDHLITARILATTAGVLHHRFGAGGKSNRIDEIAHGLQKIMDTVGRTTFRDNIKAFFNVIDECFGVRNIVFTEGSVHLRGTFLHSLAEVFTRHSVFWDGNRLSVDRATKKKLSSFPVTDPHVRDLAGSGTQGGKILYQLMVEHLNHKRKHKRLRSDW